MKTTIFTAALAIIVYSAGAQKLNEKDVPSNVKQAFKDSHTGTKDIKWEKEGENYEAEFKAGTTEQSVLLDNKGSILETETEIPVSELPASITEYVSKNYNNAKIKEAAKIMDASNTLTYEAEIKGKDLIFDHTGKFIKETKD